MIAFMPLFYFWKKVIIDTLCRVVEFQVYEKLTFYIAILNYFKYNKVKIPDKVIRKEQRQLF